MKKVILLVLSILLITSVFALECQYTKNESYEEFGQYLFDENGNYWGEPLILKDFIGSYCGFDCSGTPSFKIYNPYSFDISINLTALIFKPAPSSAYPEAKQNINVELNIPAYEEGIITGTNIGIGSNYFPNDSISYEITIPEKAFLKKGYKPLQKEVCELCQDGKICLNDGELCNPLYDNEKCGSGICNIAGFCGKTKVVECPLGKFNCNNKSCFNIGNIDFPNGTEKGCERACKYSGKEGNCFENPDLIKDREDVIKKKWIILITLIIILIAISIWVFAVFKRRKEEQVKDKVKAERIEEEKLRDLTKKDKKDLEIQLDNLKIEIERVQEKIIEEQKAIKELRLEKEEIEKKMEKEREKSKLQLDEIKEKEIKEIKLLEEKKKNKKVEAQKAIEEEIDKIKIKYKDDRKRIETEIVKKTVELDKKNKDLDNQINEKKRLSEELQKENLEKKKQIKEINETRPERIRSILLNRYVNKYQTSSRKIKYDEEKERFIITSLGNYPAEMLSRYIYKKLDPNIRDKQIHHINYNELEDEPWNLIALSEEEHKKIPHDAKLIKGNWDLGIQQLKEKLGYGTKEKPFPKHIQEEIKRREEQRTLGKYAKRSGNKS